MKLSVIIPCYNEPRTIEEIVRRVEAARLPAGVEREIIIVDDGSSEETKRALARITASKRSQALRLITRTRNNGKGRAIKDALAVATGDYCLIQDADLEYDPGDYAALLAPVIYPADGGVRIVFGSRQLRDNNVPGRFYYYLGGRLVNWLFNIAFHTRLTDLTTCYKIFPRSLAPEILKQPSDDFVFDAIELPRVLAKSGIVEVPISYRARSPHEGKKLRPRDGVRCLLRIVTLSLGRYARIAKFLLVGGSAALVNLAALYLLTSVLGLWYLASSIVSFVLALVYNFVLQKFWTFDTSTENLHRQFPLFFITNVVNLGLNTVILYGLVEWAGLWYLLAQAITSFVIAFESYFIYRAIFR